MQVNLNPQQNQSFGMSLKISESAQNFLRNKGLSNKNIDKLAELAGSQTKNPYHVHVDFDHNIKSLKADIYDGKEYYELEYDGLFNKLFGNPVKFIEKCCKKADAARAKFSGNEKLDNIFNDLG